MTAPTTHPGDGSDLSARQRAIFRVVRDSVRTNGFPPSVREIAQAVGLASPSSAKHQLDILEERGYLRRVPHRPRAIEILGYIAADSSDKQQQTTPEPQSPQQSTSDTVGDPASFADDSQQLRADHEEQAEQLRALTASLELFTGSTHAVPLVGQIAAGAPITAEQAVEDTFVLPTRLTGNGELFMLSVRGDSMIDAAICDGDWVVVRQQNVAEQGEIVAAMIDGEATVKVWSQRDGHSWLLPRNNDYAPIPADECTILGKVVSVLRAI